MDGSSDRKVRIEYIDLFRAFGILLMILGHIGFGDKFSTWIHAFHMPMFFFVSGWFYRRRDERPVGRQILKKCRTLLLPYVVFELILWLLLLFFIPEYRSWDVLFKYILWENTGKIPVENGTFGISPIPGAMWFLTAIFLAETLYILIDRVLFRGRKKHAAVIILAVFGMTATLLLPFRLPWALDAAFVGMGFFHIAVVIRGSKAEKLLHLKPWAALSAFVLFSVSAIICPMVNMRTGSYGLYITFWVNALGLTGAVWNLARYLDEYAARHKLPHMIGDRLKGIGRNSIVYLCLNQIVILAVKKCLDLIGLQGFWVRFLVFVPVMLILFCLEKLICDTRLKILIGR